MVKTLRMTKIFRTDEIETTALDSVDLEVNKGEFIAITGPSGCGKSTLLNILGMIDSLSEGQYFFNNIDISHFNENQKSILRKKNIGFVFQSYNLIDELTIFENIELPLLYLNIPKNDRKKAVNEVMGRMEIAHRTNHFPKQLSGGQQQRAAVARAIITNPSIILADEPTGNLDSKNGDEVMKLLLELNNSGATIVMVTHSSEYANYASRTVKLFDGRII